jgi:hypothetical protein
VRRRRRGVRQVVADPGCGGSSWLLAVADENNSQNKIEEQNNSVVFLFRYNGVNILLLLLYKDLLCSI